MRDDFEFHGQGACTPSQAHSQQDAVFMTDQMTVDPLPKDSLERQAWRSTWQDAGWLQHNPLVSKKRKISHNQCDSDNERDHDSHNIIVVVTVILKSNSVCLVSSCHQHQSRETPMCKCVKQGGCFGCKAPIGFSEQSLLHCFVQALTTNAAWNRMSRSNV